MIGFEDEPTPEKGYPNETPETKHLSKRLLYKTIALKFSLPPYNSRGVSRKYLIKVHNGEVYRVLDLELKTFEVQLTSAMLKRVGIQNNSFLVRKMNVLLHSRKQPELGFDEFDPPEEVDSSNKTWFYRIVRFFDPTNLLEFFEVPVYPEPVLTDKSTMIQAVFWGRLKASKYFFRFNSARMDRRLWDAIKTLSNNYKSYLSHRMVVERIQNDLKIVAAKTAELERTMEDQIHKIAISYASIESPKVRPGMIVNDSANLSKEDRENILFSCQL